MENSQKKEREQAEWERITTFVGHRDGITDLSSCKWEKNSFATASAGMEFSLNFLIIFGIHVKIFFNI